MQVRLSDGLNQAAQEDPWWFAAHLYGDTREGDGDGWSQLGNLSVGGNTEELRK